MATAWYSGYGLLIRSDIDLPELAPAPAPAGALADIVLRLGPEAAEAAPRPAGTPHADADFAPARCGGFAMDLVGVGRFLVRGGREIVVTPDPGADPGELRLYLLGSVLGMALHQRGLVVLHGATVAAGEGAAVIVGDTGSGKSTLVAALDRAGLAVLGDDTMPLWPRAGDGWEVWPGSRVSKLWSDALDGLGIAAEGLEVVASRYRKFYVPRRVETAGGARGLREILLLDTHDGPPELHPLGRLDAVAAVAAHTYRPGYLDLLGRRAEHFRDCAALVAVVPVSRLARPRGLARLDETVALLRRRWHETGRNASRCPTA